MEDRVLDQSLDMPKSNDNVQYEWSLNSKKRLIHISQVPEDRKQRRRIKFICPSCGNPLIPKKGAQRAHHFSHKGQICDFDTYTHKIAKMKIIDLFQLKPYPKIIAPCSRCKEYITSEHHFQDYSLSIDLKEYMIQYDEKQFRIDVIVQGKNTDQPLFGIEVCHKHAVKGEKISAIKKSRIPVFEVDTDEILKQNPTKRKRVEEALQESEEKF